MVLQQIYSGNCVPKRHQNRRSFVGDITKKHFGLTFFRTNCSWSHCAM